jgi:hypothetical protein
VKALWKGVNTMPLERNNVVNSFKADVETRLDNDRNKEASITSEAVEDNSNTQVQEQGKYSSEEE